MENASKALLIAAGMLFAMLIVSLLVLMFNNISTIGKSAEDKRATEQLLEFNRKFEPYNKKVLYGTDVITVINKAIENNYKADVDPEHPWYVDVELKIDDDYVTTQVTKVIDEKGKEKSSNTDRTTLINPAFRLTGKTEPYKLLESTTLTSFFMNNEPKDEIISENKNTPTLGQTTIVYRYSALTDFKRAIFTCVGIEYNESRTSFSNKV